MRVSYTHRIITPSVRRMLFSFNLLSKYANPDMMVSRTFFFTKSTFARLVSWTKISRECSSSNLNQDRIDRLLLFKVCIFFILNKIVFSGCVVYMNVTDMILTHLFAQVYRKLGILTL